MASGMEMMLNFLFDKMGISKEEIMESAQSMQSAVIDIRECVVSTNERLSRIEQHLGIAPKSALIFLPNEDEPQ